MWQKEGFYGLLKGNGVNVVRIAPFSAFEFFFYDLYKTNIFGGQTATPMSKLVCGGLTGITASFLTYPLDLIRTVMSVKVDGI
jgi:solute carrier family 25 phosphate transporter 23/24/25/41